MTKSITVSTRIHTELHQMMRQSAEEVGMTQSEWLQEAIFCFGCWLSDTMDVFEDEYGYTDEGYSWEDLEDMDWEELSELVDSEDLDVNPTDHRGFLNKDEQSFRDAVGEALGLQFEDEEQGSEAEEIHQDED